MHPLEGGSEVADIGGGSLLEQPDFAVGNAVRAEGQAHVLEERPAVLEVDKRSVKSAVERFTPHRSAPRIAWAAAAVARVQKPYASLPQQRTGPFGCVQNAPAAERLIRRDRRLSGI